MRKIIILSLFLFSLLVSRIEAQDYVPVIINGEVFFKTELETSDGPVFSEVTVANFEKLNGVLYNRVFFKRGFEPDMLIGHLREEPELGRLYFRPLSATEDIIVYDISLQVGDAITLQARWCDAVSGDVATVVEVIEAEGAREVVFDRQVGEQDICETLRFIEGVGPNASVIFPYFRGALLENGAAQRLCHASHSAAIYYPADSAIDLCGFDFTPTSEVNQQQVDIFPNPAYDFISIALSEDFEIDFASIYNGQGKLVWRGRLERGHSIDVSTLTPALYHLVLEGEGKQQFSQRFVKF